MPNTMSAQPCGCDEGANHRCADHVVSYAKAIIRELIKLHEDVKDANPDILDIAADFIAPGRPWNK